MTWFKSITGIMVVYIAVVGRHVHPGVRSRVGTRYRVEIRGRFFLLALLLLFRASIAVENYLKKVVTFLLLVHFLRSPSRR